MCGQAHHGRESVNRLGVLGWVGEALEPRIMLGPFPIIYHAHNHNLLFTPSVPPS